MAGKKDKGSKPAKPAKAAAKRAAPSADEDAALCPSCSALVSPQAKECPECGEAFKPGTFAEPGPGDAAKIQRVLFYAGILAILVGGPGVALGSWLHDVLRIPIGGNAFDVFGPYNRFTSAIGLVVLTVGIVLLILSIRIAKPVLEDDYDVGATKPA